jgi:small subunit ribosomal protein S1
VEGLVHISELADHHVETPGEVVNPGEEVRVKILEIDEERRRISLSIKRVGEGGMPLRDAFQQAQVEAGHVSADPDPGAEAAAPAVEQPEVAADPAPAADAEAAPEVEQPAAEPEAPAEASAEAPAEPEPEAEAGQEAVPELGLSEEVFAEDAPKPPAAEPAGDEQS